MNDAEKEFDELLNQTVKAAMLLTTSHSTASREHSLCYTKLQEAQHWHDQDRAEKDYRQAQRDKHPV